MTAPLSLEALRSDVAEALAESPTELDENENLLDRGLDSIRIMSLVEQWRRAGFETSYLDLAERPTLSAWWALLAEQQSTAGNSTGASR